jgi:glutamine synthetase
VLKRVLERFTELGASLPLTIWRALDCIQQAAILPQYFGADYLQIYHQIKQAEFDAFMEAIHAREYAWYL